MTILNVAYDDSDPDAPVLATKSVGAASASSTAETDDFLSAHAILERVLDTSDNTIRTVTV